MDNKSPTNQEIATALDQIADFLEAKKDNVHRINAYRRAVSNIRSYNKPIIEIYSSGGVKALQSIPGIGKVMARIIEELINTGDSELLKQLQSEITLDDQSTHKQDLAEEKLKAEIQSESPIHILQSGSKAGEGQEISPEPPVMLLLEIDKEYRHKSEAGELRLISPKRYNPENLAWLPIMRLKRERWSFTVLFSNTKRAHE